MDDLGAGEISFEFENVSEVGAAPTVDRLVVVADHADVSVAGSQGLHHQVLRTVRVLVLVDQDVAKAVAIAREQCRIAFEQLEYAENQVAEIHRAQLPQALLVALVDLGRLLAERVVARELRCVGAVPVVFCGLDVGANRIRGEQGLVEIGFGDELLDQSQLVVAVVDGKRLGEVENFRMAPENPGTDAVKRSGPKVAGLRPHERGAAFHEFARRLVGERNGENLKGPDPVAFEQTGDPVDEYPRLSAAGGGEQE
jgi:hypothetical protein